MTLPTLQDTTRGSQTTGVFHGLTVSGQPPYITPLATRIPASVEANVIRLGAAEPTRIMLEIGPENMRRHVALTPDDTRRFAHQLLTLADQTKEA